MAGANKSTKPNLPTTILQNDHHAIRADFLRHLEFSLGKDFHGNSKLDNFKSIALAVRDRLAEKWLTTQRAYYEQDAKRVYYLSLEFLMGRTLGNALINLNLVDEAEKALKELGLSLSDLEEAEVDAGLGNGGLGRLAACFLDSMATLQLPAYGYGIRYEYGIFYQKIVDGFQVEMPDNWLRRGTPWEYERAEILYPVHFYGEVSTYTDAYGAVRYKWINTEEIVAMAYDYLIPGYKTDNVNTLRLWAAKSSRDFLFEEFNAGDYEKAVSNKNNSEVISKVLYPNDNRYSGKELRLKQQYFFVCATLQDAIRRYKKSHPDKLKFENLKDKVAFQLNDTHPSIAIPELMRILLDENGLSWEEAWSICVEVFAYTNHTVLPEALEKWPVALMESVLPRHMAIIYEINNRFIEMIKTIFPGDVYRYRRMSIIEEGQEKMVRMSNLAIIGSHKVNGVAALHTQILKDEVFKDFYELWPDRFVNKTNGITFRRFLIDCNPHLTDWISSKIGTDWLTDLDQMKKLEKVAGDPKSQKEWLKLKKEAKATFSIYLKENFHFEPIPDSIFDFQVKRIHEYKRQLMNALHVITLYHRIKENPSIEMAPRTVFFGGKAAPGYYMAKLIIKLINAIAEVVNNDPHVNKKLKVFYIPNYSVSFMERLLPASELSEQISTAGMEASGTGNMKFAVNGALTIGTLDGANIEIMEEVGQDNIFIFGYTDKEIAQIKKSGYHSSSYYDVNPELKKVIDSIASGHFSPEQPDLFVPIVNHLMYEGDRYFVMADYAKYIECQDRVADAYQHPLKWAEMAIHNIAKMSKFSSDRTIKEYAKEVWNVKPVKVELRNGNGTH